jgi:hypothetical protein
MKSIKSVATAILIASMLTMAALTPTATAAYVPDSDNTENSNGRQTVVKTYTLAPEDSPDALIEPPFTRSGYSYEFMSITKAEQHSGDKQHHTETVTLYTATDKLSDILSNLAPAMEYTQDGYNGTLALDHTTIKTEASGYSSHSYTITDTKVIEGLDSNDISYVPKTTVKSGLTLSLAGVDWSTSGASEADGALVPTRFTATASYTGKGYGKTADGYVTTAEYSGELEKHGVEAIVYTVTYIGEEISPPKTDTVQERASVPAYIIIVGGVALLALVSGAALFVIRKRRAEYDTPEAYIPAGREEPE